MKKGYKFPLLNALKFFVENPYEEIHLREFARRMNISINSAQRFLKIFLEEDLIKDERRVNLRYFKANIDSIVFRNIKLTFSLKDLEDSELINSSKELCSHLVLFGSVAQGKDDCNSDIDLMIIGKDKEKIKNTISKVQKKFNKKINSHIFSLTEWRNQKEKNKAFYQEVISTGINLIGETPIID